MMQPDWHPADIIAGLRKRGTSLAKVSRSAGLASATLANALTRSWPRGEKLIADALETSPEIIWPSRYFDNQGNRIVRLMRERRS
ncbi:helix-turn-helix domain-containing protein [Escherichia coli]|uniref:Transcriptional regulator n=1 Tax=Escherichia coli TaxID=562 RepID=A0A0L7ANC5_ECOLX|nr:MULTISPECIES: helix-turn-helix transcriptional regulator [Escherichia]EHQ5576203.1 helix-turn-helix domain-containing protein [Escherichia coli O2]EGE63719.1 sugar fermentation stimulation protein B [Escherichia coli STEC_7v]EGO6586751.1 transcriptional regulator [Escherichia coli]EGO7491465.1 transcriptional regulator [Escherichia coli]EGO7966740.1 transcriptional regulator [Escherichia coli]